MFEKISKWFEGIFTKYHNSLKEKRIARAKIDAETIFQVCEFKGELWFTYNDDLVCPMAAFKDAPMEVLQKMRVLYIVNEKDD